MTYRRIQDQDVKGSADVTLDSDLINDTKIYVTGGSPAINKRLDQAITDGDIGGGGDVFEFSYIPKSAVAADFTAYKNTTPSNKPDDFGGTPSGSLSLTDGTGIDTEGNLSLSKGNANTQGEGFYYEFTPETKHENIMLLTSFFANLSELDDDEISIWLVGSDDSFVADFELISPADPDVKSTNPIYKQIQLGTKAAYRYCIHWNSTDLTIKTARIADLFYGPKTVATGAVITDWEDKTTGFIVNNVSVSESIFKTRRVGDSVEIAGSIELSGTVSGEIQIEFPYNVDDLKLSNDRSSTGMVLSLNGDAGAFDRGSNRFYSGLVSYDQNNDRLVFSGPSGVDSTGTWDAAYPFAWANTDEIHFRVLIPVQGWSSNARISEDFGSREIIVASVGSSASVIPIGGRIPFDNVIDSDTTNSWSGDTFSCPETGWYDIKGHIFTSTTGVILLQLNINNSDNLVVSQSEVDAGTTRRYFNGTVYLEKGDDVYLKSNSSLNLVSSNFSHWIFIGKRSNPQSLLETESVSAEYSSNAGTLLVNAVVTTIPYEDRDRDTHNAYNTSTGIYTVPTSGTYQINAQYTANWDLGVGDRYEFRLYVDAVIDTSVFYESTGTNTTTGWTQVLSRSVYLEKGQEFYLAVLNNTGVNRSLSTTSYFNRLSITRIK